MNKQTIVVDSAAADGFAVIEIGDIIAAERVELGTCVVAVRVGAGSMSLKVKVGVEWLKEKVKKYWQEEQRLEVDDDDVV